MYTSSYSQVSADAFLNSLQIKPINRTEKELCDRPVTICELMEAINHLKNSKSPGTDGLTSEFYKLFSKELAPFLLEVFVESIKKQCLTPTLTQGLIVLLPKPNKDRQYIDNWHPICLLNNDYKLLALILARRLKTILDSVIDESQSGFMKNRHITNNIRLVLDILDYSDLINDNGFILFLDFCKAFDSVEHLFILDTLKKFDFGILISAIETLYQNGNCSIKLFNGTSPRFDISKAFRQGCPVSPYLFLLVSQLLSSYIKSSPMRGITIVDREIKITQLADDTTLFIQNESQISVAIDLISEFSRASGVYLNLAKCELMAIKECLGTNYYGIPLKYEIQYLGILITKDQKRRCLLNFNPIIEKTKNKLNHWLIRDLSLRGRVLITKAEGISRLIYAAMALHLGKKLCKEIDKILIVLFLAACFNFSFSLVFV